MKAYFLKPEDEEHAKRIYSLLTGEKTLDEINHKQHKIMQVFTEQEVNAARKIFKYWRESSPSADNFQYFLDQEVQIAYPAQEPEKPTYAENLDKYMELSNQVFDFFASRVDNVLKIKNTSNTNEVLAGYEIFSRIYLNALELQKKNSAS